MNQLSIEKRARVFACLAEGNSLRATARLTGVCFNAVLQLLPKLGRACTEFQDVTLRNLPCKRLQADEIWAFVGCKEKNVTAEKKAQGQGDAWTWLAMCADTKLLACWYG